MSDDATTQTPADTGTLDHAALMQGARELARSLGIDAEPERAEPWPIDVGQRSITTDFRGDTASGTIYLSLIEDEAERLLNDPDGADGVIRDLLLAVGIAADELDRAPFEPASDLPELHVVARDGEKILGFGVTVHDPESDPAGGGASAFEPMPITPPGAAGGATLGAPLTLLADVDMQVTVELGRTTLPVRELLSLQPGMVVELDRQAGAPIDVLVNGRLIARGEVVVLDEQFGLRVTEIVTDIVGGR